MKRYLLVFTMCLLLIPLYGISEKANMSGIVGDHTGNITNISELSAGVATVETVEIVSDLPRSSELTLMIYLCGSNLETGFMNKSEASKDLVEMALSGFDEERLNVVVMAGGSKRWYLDQISSRSTGIYQVGERSITKIYDDGTQHNMGDPATLTQFLNYTVETYPSEAYALILWDHGGGSLGGICHDVNFDDDCLNMVELNAALAGSSFHDKKLHWVGLDACLMASAEVAQVLAPYAEYMIASEEIEPGIGWNYSFLKDLNLEETPSVTGERIVTSYLSACKENFPRLYDSKKYTLSCVDLSKVEGVYLSLNRFISSISRQQDRFAQISRLRRGMTAFGRDEEDSDYDFDLVDLGSMIDQFESIGSGNEAIAVRNALNDCVLISGVSKSDESCSGLTLYFPFYNKGMYPYRIKAYSIIAEENDYISFIQEFGDTLVGYRDETWNVLNSTELQDAQRDNRTIVNLPLDDKQLYAFELAEIVALQKREEDAGWHLVATQPAQLSSYGSVSGEYVHTNLFVTDAEGNPLSEVPLYYIEQDDGLIAVPVILNSENGDRVNARLICMRDEATGMMGIEDVYLYDDVLKLYTSRLAATLSDYVSVSYIIEEKQETYQGENNDSPLKPFNEWDVVGQQEYTWRTDSEWGLCFIRDRLDTGTISVAFQITDIFNDIYMSRLVRIQGAQGKGIDQVLLLDYDDNKILNIDQASVSLTDQGLLLFQIENLCEEEMTIYVRKVKVNGAQTNLETFVKGKGTQGGLLPGEKQMAMLILPVEVGHPIEEVDMTLTISETKGKEEEEIGVRVRKY